MNTDPKGNKAPAGGFKDLGWYSGYQYYQGSFAPSAGSIHPSSPQQGAGKAVSSEVNRQSDAAQGLAPGTIDNYVAQQNTTPNNSGGGDVLGASTGAGVFPNLAGGGGGGAIGTGAGMGYTAAETLNLPKLYEQLYASAGIKDLEAQASAKEKAFNDAQSKINDNPFLSEAQRVGRIQKLGIDYNNGVANLKNDIATKKADIEMKLNLETKQFDINSQSAKQALDTFNSLLTMGALENASGDDIANITRSTGLSSSAIQSAVSAQRDKNIQTSVISYDDGTNQGFAVINTKTGQVISKQTVAASKPDKTSGTSAANQKIMDTQQNQSNASSDAKRGATLSQLIGNYGVAGGLTVDQIYSIYNANSPRGLAKESLSQAKQGIFADAKGFTTEAQQKAAAAKASKSF